MRSLNSNTHEFDADAINKAVQGERILARKVAHELNHEEAKIISGGMMKINHISYDMPSGTAGDIVDMY